MSNRPRFTQPPLMTTVPIIPYNHQAEVDDLTVTLAAAGLVANRAQVEALLTEGMRGVGAYTHSHAPADQARANETGWRIVAAVKNGEPTSHEHPPANGTMP